MLRFSKEISLIAICNFLIINSCKIWNLHDIRRFFQLDHCNSILRFFQIHNTDYSDIFNLVNPDDFVFLDPPYDCIFSDYGNIQYQDGFNEENHRRLAEDFYNLGCRSLMVIGDTPLIRDLYGNNIMAEYDKNYSVNIRNRFQAEATHLIITNYEL